jgi:hypothetical protein
MKTTIHENKNNRYDLSKKVIYSIAFIALLASLTSCTADELELIKNTDSTTTMAKDIDPPPKTPPIPPPTNP